VRITGGITYAPPPRLDSDEVQAILDLLRREDPACHLPSHNLPPSGLAGDAPSGARGPDDAPPSDRGPDG
jgi:hypothetical protein